MPAASAKKESEFIKARDYAYRLLGYRFRSAKEMKERLKRRGYSCETIKKTIGYLAELNYINDEDFARFWVRSKIQSKPVGWSLLCYQLRQKGIAEEIIEKVLSALRGQYNEAGAAKELVALRRRYYKNVEPLKLKKRLYGYLRRRGFSQEAILQAIE